MTVDLMPVVPEGEYVRERQARRRAEHALEAVLDELADNRPSLRRRVLAAIRTAWTEEQQR